KPHTNDTTALRRALESVIDHAQCCDHCGQPATAADPLSPYDWQGRPDGIWLHRQCEARWFDSHGPAPVSAPDPTPRTEAEQPPGSGGITAQMRSPPAHSTPRCEQTCVRKYSPSTSRSSSNV